MKLEEALQDTGIAEASYDNRNAVVTRKQEGYQLTLQQGTHPPYFTRDGLRLSQVEDELRILRASYPLDWNPVELEG